MYKKHLKVQKIICLAAIIVSVIVFIYALGIMTDLYDALYSTMRNPADHTQTDVPGSLIYYEMQAFNRYFLNCSIILILLACLLFITNTHCRRKYYIGNYISIGAFSVFSIYLAINASRLISICKQKWLKVDFAALKEHADMWGTLYTESTFWFDIRFLVFGLLLVVVAALIGNAYWKMQLMKEEEQLLEAGRKVIS